MLCWNKTVSYSRHSLKLVLSFSYWLKNRVLTWCYYKLLDSYSILSKIVKGKSRPIILGFPDKWVLKAVCTSMINCTQGSTRTKYHSTIPRGNGCSTSMS